MCQMISAFIHCSFVNKAVFTEYFFSVPGTGNIVVNTAEAHSMPLWSFTDLQRGRQIYDLNNYIEATTAIVV